MRLRNIWWTNRNRRVGGTASGQPSNDSRPPKRPYYLTSLLAQAAKRGTQPARSEVRDVAKISDNEILFTVLTLTSTPPSPRPQ